MKIDIKRLGGAPITFEAFADRHGLVMKIVERPKPDDHRQFIASFEGVEIKSGAFLGSISGNGDTVDDAIAVYKTLILGKQLVKNAFHRNRQAFQAPNEWEDAGDKS